MTDHEQYIPGPASGAQVRKDGEKWTLILVRELRHSPERVWQALTEPAHLREWAPFEVDGNLGTVGTTVNLTWVGTPTPLQTTVTRADAPNVLEYNDTRWELEPVGSATRLTLWHKIDRRFISWGAAGWHIGLDVLDRLLAGEPIGRIAGAIIGSAKISFEEIGRMPHEMSLRGVPVLAVQLARRKTADRRDQLIVRLESPLQDTGRINEAALAVLRLNRQVESLLNGNELPLPVVEVYPPGALRMGQFKLRPFVDERHLAVDDGWAVPLEQRRAS